MIKQITPEMWEVSLTSTHSPYANVLFKPELEDTVNWPIVCVSTEKLLACWERNALIVGHVGCWPREKLAGIQSFLDPSGGPVYAPRIGINLRERRRRFLGRTPRPLPVVSFINGRHRARYVINAGADELVVQVHASQRDALVLHCGV